MDAFEDNKFNNSAYIKRILSNTTIVSYGFITSVDFDSVIVTLAVTDRSSAEKVRCTFMNIGNEFFSLSLKPAKGMKVMVLSPNKAAEGMYESAAQIQAKEGQDFILSRSPSSYSSQFAFCIPVMKATSQALSALIIDDQALTAEIKHEFLATLYGTVEIDLQNDSIIELQEGTTHFRGCYGDMEQTFGMVEGISGVEKPGNYVYKETYGKHSSVEKNYESGIKTTIGKAYEKPFLTNKGAIVDSSAPVTIELGAQAPVNVTTGAPITLVFGEDVITIAANPSTGLNITLKGTTKVSIMTATGLLKVGNNLGTLAVIFDELITVLTSLGTAGTAAAQTVDPATVAALETVKTKMKTIFE